MCSDAPHAGEPPPGHDGRPSERLRHLRMRPPHVVDMDTLELTDAGSNVLQDDLSLTVADARNVISSMSLDELRTLTASVADDAFDQIAAIRTAIVAANRHDLVASFERIADAWEASHVARISIATDAE